MKFSTNILTKIIFPVAILLTSALIIFYKFPSIPQGAAVDEFEFAKLVNTLDNAPYTPYTHLATGHATMYFYMILFAVKLFGTNLFSVRIVSAIFGVLNSIILYAIFYIAVDLANLKNKTAKIFLPFLTTFIFITMRWYFGFARFAFEATTVLFFELLGVLSFFLYKKKKSLKYIFATGLFAGLAYNSYTPGRIFFLIPLFFLIFETGLKKVRIDFDALKKMMIFLIPFIIVIIPINAYFQNNKDIRIYQLFYLQNENLSVSEKIEFSLQNVTRVFGQFAFQGDTNGRHNYPGKAMLNPIQLVLMFVGFLIATKNWRKFENRFFLLYFFIGIIPPMLTYPWENPNALRTVTVLPSLAYFAGLTLNKLLNLNFSRKIMVSIIFIVLILSAVYDLRTYFVFQTKVFPEAFELNPDLIDDFVEGKYIFDANNKLIKAN